MIYKFDKIYNVKDNMEIHYTQDIDKIFLHAHDFYEIMFLLSDSCVNTVNGKQFPMKKYDACIITDKDSHEIASESNIVLLNISFRKEFFEECCGFIFGTGIPMEFDRIQKFTPNDEIGFRNIYLKLNFMSDDERQYFQKKLAIEFILKFASKKNIDNKSLPDWLMQTIMYLNNTMNYSIDNIYEECYKISGYSKSQFNRLFKKYVGETPTEYLARNKIEYSCCMLVETKYTIGFISNYLGFFSTAHYIHLFKKYKNTTPLQYRKEVLKDKQN